MAASISTSLPIKPRGDSDHLRHHHHLPRFCSCPFRSPIASSSSRRPSLKARAELSGSATADGEGGAAAAAAQQQQKPTTAGVEECVGVLKNAAKTRRVPAVEVLAALAVIKQAKVDASTFLQTLGGSESPGRTWMLIFTAQDRLERGSYFPVTAVQRFDAAAKRIENGVYLGPLGCMTFEGRFSWKTRKLAFIFEHLQIKVGPFGPLQIGLGKQEAREPNTKDPFFIWFYADEEIAVAQGKGGGTAFWCRCRRIM